MNVSSRAPVAYIKRRADFVSASSGRRYRCEQMTVQGRYRQDDGVGVRFGLTVTKRVGNAVERNRIKRRLRAALPYVVEPYIGMNLDIVIIARRELLTYPFLGIQEILNTAFSIVSKRKKSFE